MNLKKITALCASFVLASTISAGARTLEFTMGNNTMYESTGKIESHTLENAPYTKNDRTMVPVRIISERFGAEVGWDGDKSQVSVKKGDKDIILTLNSDVAIVNGAEVKLDVSPEEFNGRTMVPLRFISETLEMDVKYIASTEQVVISDEEPLLTINGKDITIDDYRSLMAFFAYQNPDVMSVSEFIRTVYSASTAVLAEGNATLGNDREGIFRQLNNSGVDFYANNALMAPLVELIEHYNVIYEVGTGYLLSMEEEKLSDLVLGRYQQDYVTAKHILVLSQTRTDEEAKKLAEEILAKIKKGEDFDALMHKHGEDPGLINNPEGYTFTYGEMVEPFEKAAFELKEGEVSEIIETSYGYHIIKREPLKEIDDYYTYVVMQSISDELFNERCIEGLKNAEIILHKTDSEIAELLK